MACCVWLNRRWQYVEFLHCRVEATGIVLCYLHWLYLLQTCLLCYLILALISIMLQVTNIRDVTDIANLIADMLKITEKDIECDSWTSMTKMRVTINCRTADIHAYMTGIDWLKSLLLTSKSIVY